MKNAPSRYILAAEILVIILFHLVKLNQVEKNPADSVYSHFNNRMNLQKPVLENKAGTEYMLVNLLK